VTGCAATLAPHEFGPDVLCVPNAHKMELPERVLERLRLKYEGAREWEQRYAEERTLVPIEPLFGSTRERAVIKIQTDAATPARTASSPRWRGASTMQEPRGHRA
jgi:hypothetical protein